MSTRGLYGFILDGKKYLTYNHSDSYPSGLGIQIVDFLNSHKGDLESEVRKLTLVNSQDIPSKQEAKLCKEAHLFNGRVDNRQNWYAYLRGAQGDLEATLAIGYMIDSADFLEDSLCCEWAYIINLDTACLEVYDSSKRILNCLFSEITAEKIRSLE